jgi:hypothetical protein
MIDCLKKKAGQSIPVGSMPGKGWLRLMARGMGKRL